MERNRSTILGVAIVFLVILFGFSLRAQNLREWKKHPERAFLPDGRPVLIDFDGYRYLRYAKELVEGKYTGGDRLRAAPEGMARPRPASLLSVLTAGMIRVSGCAPEWVAAWIPPILGSFLLALALYLMGNFLGGFNLGLFAAMFGVCSPFFVFRSQFGRFDTDCAIPGLVVLLVFFSLRTFSGSVRSRWGGLAGFLVTAADFFWWWDTARGLVVFLGAMAMLLAGIAAIPSQKIFKASTAILILIALLFVSLNSFGIRPSFLAPFQNAISVLLGGEGKEYGSIAEQQHLAFFPLIASIAGSGAAGLAALAGWLWMGGIRRGRAVVALGLILLLGILPFLGSQRFAVFSAPLIGIGLGVLLDVLLNKISASWRRGLVAVVACAILLFPSLRAIAIRTDWPMVTPQAIHGMEQVAPLLPENSVVWSWWDNGYHLMYYTGRATIEDGGCFRVPAFNAFPLCVSDERLAANYMSFYASRGEERVEWAYKKYGSELIHQLLAAGPREGVKVLADFGHKPARETIDFFFPPENERRPVFLFLDHIYLHTGYWWFWYGSKWSESQDQHPVFKVFYSIREAEGQLTGNPDFTINLATGAMQFEGQSHRLNRVLARRPENVKAYDYSGDSEWVFEYDTKKNFGLLCSFPVADSMFSRLFFFDRGRFDHFELLLSNTPHVQVWRVRPDLP